MKAVLEFDAPVSCVGCRLGQYNPAKDKAYCYGIPDHSLNELGNGDKYHNQFNQRRPSNCPLIFKADSIEEVDEYFKNMGTDDIIITRTGKR